MKHEYPEIFKKAYHKPSIEEILLDREMSLVMQSTPPTEPTDPPPLGVSPETIDYGNDTYKKDYPLGGDRIVY